MSQPIRLLPERSAVQQAIRELEAGRADAALDLLRRALSRRKPPKEHADRRTADIVRLRAHIEKSIVELEHNGPTHALRTLQLAQRGLGQD